MSSVIADPPAPEDEGTRPTSSYVGLDPLDARRSAGDWLAMLPWEDTGESLETMTASRLLQLL